MMTPTKKRSLKGQAFFYLSRREYSRVELARKLAPWAESEAQLEIFLDELEAQSWLSAQRFADSLLRRQAGRLGNARLLHELKKHQLDEAVINHAHTQLQGSEYARAQVVWQKKFGHTVLLSKIENNCERAKERAKQMRFLLMRGFSADIAARVVDTQAQSCGEILE